MTKNNAKRWLCGLTALLLLVCIETPVAKGQESIIIDSQISLSEALKGSIAPPEILRRQQIVSVEYYSTDGLLHRGQIVIDSSIVRDITEIFGIIKEQRIPVEMVIPIKFDLPGGNTTMANLNNTYGFHYRRKAGGKTSLSNHSYGMAVDLNPFNNPYISSSGVVIPKGCSYRPGTDPLAIVSGSKLVEAFKKRGWIWGGDWRNPKDYMHFEKRR